jgi:peroxiredoxin
MTLRVPLAVAAILASTALAIAAPSRDPAVMRTSGGPRTYMPEDEGCDARQQPARLDFKLKDISGATVKLADFKGKVIVLNFWATWCVPCKAEIPDFVDLQTRHADEGLQLLGISADDTIAKLKPFVDAQKMNYPVLQGRGHTDLLDAYSISALPVTLVIGRDGGICRRYAAPIAKDILERQIKSLL